MKKILVTLFIGIMLGYMLGLVHQLAQKRTVSKMEKVQNVVISKMETTTPEVKK